MDRTVLVTGGSRGIGSGICIELARRGFSVGINYAGNRKAAEKTKKSCIDTASKESQRFEIFQADISSHKERQNLIDEVYSFFGSIDGLINNAGIAPLGRADLLETSEDSFDRVIAVNLKAPFFLSQAVARRWTGDGKDMVREIHKTIIFITSVSSEIVSVNRGEYCISKAGLSMTARLFAARFASEGILVYEIRPGIIATDMTEGVKTKYDKKINEGLVPQKRWGTPSDIGKSAASLLSGDFAFSTGSVISVDGGLHISKL